MKTVNGGLLIIIAFFVLWIGVTGRFPKLVEAIGLVRGNAPKSPPESGGKFTSSVGSVSPANSEKPLPNIAPEITRAWSQLWYNFTHQYTGVGPLGVGSAKNPY